jgi:hypothetical protein
MCASIDFEAKTRTVRWGVSENNHAVEEARSHPVGRAFFKALGAIQWTRGTGGYLKYTSEYDVDGDDFRHEPRITTPYGPIGDKERGYSVRNGQVMFNRKRGAAARF